MSLLRHIDPRFIAWALLWAVVTGLAEVIAGIDHPPFWVALFLGGASGLLSPWRLFR